MKAAEVAQQPLDGKTALGAAVCALAALGAWTGMVRLGVIEVLFLLAPWIVVPVAAHLLPDVDGSGLSRILTRAVDWLVLPSAALATASFVLPIGVPSAMLAGPWLMVCLLFAGDGLLRLWRYRAESFAHFSFAAGETYLVVGALWLVASRLGARPLGFEEPIVLLTAVHFHFAGFLSAVLAGLTYGRLRGTKWAAPLRLALPSAVIGPALLATAFLVGPKAKLAAVLLIVVGQMGLAAGMLRVGVARGNRVGRWLLVTASACVVAGMALAVTWALGEYPLHPFVNLDSDGSVPRSPERSGIRVVRAGRMGS